LGRFGWVESTRGGSKLCSVGLILGLGWIWCQFR